MLIASLLVIALFSYGYYQQYPARSFCASIPESSLPGEVMSMAREKGLPVFDEMKSSNRITILNHQSPFFRIACEVEFTGNHISSKGIVGAD